MILDYLAGLLCLAIALFLATINILTNPSRRHWMDCPAWVRNPMFISAGCFVYRGATLFEAAKSDQGHMTVDGLLAIVAIAMTLGTLTAYILTRTYPIRVWDRLKWVQERACCAGDREVAVMMPRAKVFDLLQSSTSFIAQPSMSPSAIDDATVRAKAINR